MDQVCFITGSAKRIGAFTAQYLHQLGYNIVVHCNQSRREAEQLCQRLNEQRASSARLVQGDLADLNQIERIAQQAIDAFGKLDILINNASGFYPTPVGQFSPNDWQSLMGSNAQGPLFLCQNLQQELSKQGGVIINMVDIHAFKPLPSHTIYCMAKSALVTMTQSLAIEMAPNVRVNGVAPGAILWPSQTLTEQEKGAIINNIPLSKLGSCEDIAKTIHFLITSPYITGQIIKVDGGRSLAPQTKV